MAPLEGTDMNILAICLQLECIGLLGLQSIPILVTRRIFFSDGPLIVDLLFIAFALGISLVLCVVVVASRVQYLRSC